MKVRSHLPMQLILHSFEPYETSEEKGYIFLNSSADFQRAVNELNSHVSERASAVADYLD